MFRTQHIHRSSCSSYETNIRLSKNNFGLQIEFESIRRRKPLSVPPALETRELIPLLMTLQLQKQ